MGVDFSRLDMEEPERPPSHSTSAPFTLAESQPGERTREPTEKQKTKKTKRERTESRLAVLHTLRCLLGPLVESMILLDRLVWIREELAGVAGGAGIEMDVQLVNLFDQDTGSGRNVGIVIKPSAE